MYMPSQHDDHSNWFGVPGRGEGGKEGGKEGRWVAVTMIPAKTHCPLTWTLEYSGYYMVTTIAPE